MRFLFRDKKKIMHIGISDIFRAHFAQYIQELNEKNREKWDIIVFHPTNPYLEKNIINYINTHKKYTIRECSSESDKLSIIKSVVAATHNLDTAKCMVKKKSVKIITLTLGANAYACIGDEGRLFITDDVLRDMSEKKNPVTIIGLLYVFLEIRCNMNEPILIINLDPLFNNGDILRVAVNEYIEYIGNDKLQAWVINNVVFYNTMIDRRTVKTVSASDTLVTEKYKAFVIEKRMTKFDHPNWDSHKRILVTPLVANYTSMKLILYDAVVPAVAFMVYIYNYTDMYQAISECKPIQKFLFQVVKENASVVPCMTSAYLEFSMMRWFNRDIRLITHEKCKESVLLLGRLWTPIIISHMNNKTSYSYMCISIVLFMFYVVSIKERDGNIFISSSVELKNKDIIREFLREVFGHLADREEFVDIVFRWTLHLLN